MPVVRPASPMLLTDQVYSALQEAILRGELPAGSRLKVRDLAEQVGTSVMPVREAIRRLEEAGLAERNPHKGAVVVELTLEEVVQIYDVRLVLEREAVLRGVTNITASDCDAMEAALGDIKVAVEERDIIGYLDHDEAFLTMLYQAGGNLVLVNVIAQLWRRHRGYKILGVQRSIDIDNRALLWQYQEDLLAAVRAHDADRATAISEASILTASQSIKDMIGTQAR